MNAHIQTIQGKGEVRKVWSPDLKACALSLRLQGETASDIGRVLGKSKKAVEAYFIRLDRLEGIPPKPSQKGVRLFWTDGRIAQLKALLASGLSRNQAGREMGVTKNAVTSIVDRLRATGVEIHCRPPSIHVEPRRRLSGTRSAPRPPQAIQHPPMTPCGLLVRTGCAFPINDGGPFLFCNNETHFPTSYCLFHRNLMVSE